MCTLLCRNTSLSPSITCVGIIYPVTTGPSLSHFGSLHVTHFRWHLPAEVYLCHYSASTLLAPSRSTSCPSPLCHQGLNLSVLMEPAAVSLYKLPQISDSSYVCWPLLLWMISAVLSKSGEEQRAVQGCHLSLHISQLRCTLSKGIQSYVCLSREGMDVIVKSQYDCQSSDALFFFSSSVILFFNLQVTWSLIYNNMVK